jgi:hypothetical protein
LVEFGSSQESLSTFYFELIFIPSLTGSTSTHPTRPSSLNMMANHS